jgi:hypothetical protein
MLYSLIASLLVAPSLALPATFPGTHSFVVKQVPGPLQLAKTYGKYAHTGAVAPADVKAAAAAVQQGSVAANPEQVRCGSLYLDDTCRSTNANGFSV